MRLVCLGLSHKTASVDVRERFALTPDDAREFGRALCEAPEVAEAFVLSTCNRVEVYAVPAEGVRDVDVVPRVLGEVARARRVDAESLESHGYVHRGRPAGHHLFRVASSLDSLVVGEPQILGQVKDGVALARSGGTLGPVLERVTAHALKTAKRVRTETQISRASVSIGSVAVDLAKRIFTDLSQVRVLLVGAGEMGEVTAKVLASSGASRVYIANRSYDRAVDLAEEHGWRARHYSELDDLLVEADVVITSTAAPEPIVTARRLKPVVRARKYRPLFFVDIAVPRNVAPDVGFVDTVYLYNVDDLEAVSRENMRQREREAQEAERIVRAELDDVSSWFAQLEVKPTLLAIRERAQALAAVEVERTFGKRLKHLGDAERKAVERLAEALVGKMLHPTMAALRREAGSARARALVDVARVLHGVDPLPGVEEDARVERLDEPPHEGRRGSAAEPDGRAARRAGDDGP